MRTVLKAAVGCATAAMIGKDSKTILADASTVDVHYVDTLVGDSWGLLWLHQRVNGLLFIA